MNIVNKKSSRVDWKYDPGDCAERIWQYWKPRQAHHRVCYMALLLIVLVAMTSCSVEKVLLRLQDIREAVGANMLEDVYEIRLTLQCNGNFDKFVASLKK